MAPEIANGRYGKEIDIYALGIILFEMLTGRVPFEGESVGEVLMKHLTAEPNVLVLDEPYRTVVARALAKDPAVRFNSVEEFMSALPPGQAGAAGYHAAVGRAGIVDGAAAAFGAAAVAAGQEATGQEVAAAAGDEDPIWTFVCGQAREVRDYWQQGNLSLPAKAAIVLAGIFVLRLGGTAWVRLIVILAAAYVVSRVIRRALFKRDRQKKSRSFQFVGNGAAGGPATGGLQPESPAPAAVPAWKNVSRPRRPFSESAATPVLLKPVADRVADLTGSMLLGACAAFVIALVMVLVRGQTAQPEQFAWLALTSTLGVWSILLPAKLWEGHAGDQVLRRFAMLLVGLGFGGAAFALDKALLVDLPFEIRSERVNEHVPASFYSLLDGSPMAPAFLAYFGFLFLAIRWWRQADPLRAARFSLWATVCSVAAAWVLNLFWPFPQPWGMMVAATISLSLQLASPWVPWHERADPQQSY